MAAAHPEIRIVTTADDRRALAKVVARATRRQLYTEPWRSTLAVTLMAVAGGVLGVVWGLAGPLVSYPVDAAGILAAALLCGVFVMGMSARTSTPRELGRSSSRAWILRTHVGAGIGTAGVLVRGVDTQLWRPVSLVAHPPRAGLGRRLGQHLLSEADRAGATIRIWCTRWLAPTYARYGFASDRCVLIWHRMHRPPRSSRPQGVGPALSRPTQPQAEVFVTPKAIPAESLPPDRARFTAYQVRRPQHVELLGLNRPSQAGSASSRWSVSCANPLVCGGLLRDDPCRE